jgi:putative transposase
VNLSPRSSRPPAKGNRERPNNSTYQRSGTLWEGRYKASVIESERYHLMCSRYIELNPVRSAMVADPADYPWSSYHWHAPGKSDPLITAHAAYLALGSTNEECHQAYRGLFRDQLDPARLQEIRESLNQCRVLGSECFKWKWGRRTISLQGQTEANVGRRLVGEARGRRRKIRPATHENVL